jgi:signal transduction histidine kinase
MWRGPAWVPDFLKLEWRFLVARWVGIFAVAVTLPFIPMQPTSREVAFGLLILAMTYSLVVVHLIRRHPHLLASGYVATTADGLLTMAMLHVSGGGDQSPLYLAIVSVSVATAMRYGYRPSLLLTLVFCAFDAFEGKDRFGTFLASGIVFRSCFLFITVLLASYIQEQAQVAQTALQLRLREAIDLNAALRQLGRRVVQVQEEERRRLSLELHDDPLQRAALLGRDIGSDVEQNDRTQRWQDAAEEIAIALRVICTGLRPPMLDDLGLVPSVESMANAVRARSDLTVRLRVESPALESFGRLWPPLELALYRVVQEAVNNVQKHARASEVSISLTRTDDSAEIRVEDDGRGFDHTLRPGIGLHGMRERLAPFGGSLTLSQSSGGGTLLVANVPLAADTTPHSEEAEQRAA